MKVLHSKRRSPKAGGIIKCRQNPIHWDEMLQKRLTRVIAGAGYGNTTFIARAAPAVETRIERDLVIMIHGETGRDEFQALLSNNHCIRYFISKVGPDMKASLRQMETIRLEMPTQKICTGSSCRLMQSSETGPW